MLQHYKDVEKTTSGDYKAGHTILSDSELEKEGKLPFLGQPTHGEGNPANPSVCLHSSRDFNGENSRWQRAVFPQTTPPPEVEKKYPIPGSKEFMADPEVKANMDIWIKRQHIVMLKNETTRKLRTLRTLNLRVNFVNIYIYL